jgi:predicted dehydrogenase
MVRSVHGRSDKVAFVAAVSRDPERARPVAAELGLALLPDLATAATSGTVDGVVLTTPHSRHAEGIALLRRHGMPVLVEKPFTLDRASAETAIAAGASLVAAAHNRRFLPAARALLARVAAGGLGTILHVEANYSGNVVGLYKPEMWRADAAESPAGGLAGSGIHMIDLIVALAGPIASAAALSSHRVAALPIDDTVAALFRLASGASATLVSVTATTPAFRLKAFGTAGAAELCDENTLAITGLDGSATTTRFPPADIERAELEAFADAVAGRTPYPVPLAEVLNGVSAFEAVAQSARTGMPVAVAP